MWVPYLSNNDLYNIIYILSSVLISFSATCTVETAMQSINNIEADLKAAYPTSVRKNVVK